MRRFREYSLTHVYDYDQHVALSLALEQRDAISKVKTSIKNIGISGGGGSSSGGSLDSLIARSFGVFKTEQVSENGSTVYYLHDKMTLEESTNIWRMSAGVFSVSSDGGQTWSAGIDADGNAVLNMLSVIGIDTKWLNVGNLTDISDDLGGWTIDADGLHGVMDYDGSMRYVDIYCPGNTSWKEDDPVISYGRINKYDGTKIPTLTATAGGKVIVTTDGSENKRRTVIYRDGIAVWDDGYSKISPLTYFNASNNASFSWKSELRVDRIDFNHIGTVKRDQSADRATLELQGVDGAKKTLDIRQGIITNIS